MTDISKNIRTAEILGLRRITHYNFQAAANVQIENTTSRMQ